MPWERISEDELVYLDPKICKKYYDLRKEEEKGPRGEGELYAEAFRLFDQGRKPADAVRELEVTSEKAKELYTEYLDMREEKDGKESEHREKKPSISEEFEIFKKRGNLTHTYEEVLGNLNYPFEPSLVGERDLIKKRIMFLREKLAGVMEFEVLEKLEELLESERKEIEALMDRDQKLCLKRLEKERAAKLKWIIQRLVGRGICEGEEEAKKYVKKHMKLMGKGVEGIYEIEKRQEMSERTRQECLKYMPPQDYRRLSMLFIRSLPSAEYLLSFWRQEQEIVARYGKQGWEELDIFYEIHRDTLAEKKPNLGIEFRNHLWKRGLQPCPYCEFLINTIGAPYQFRCRRCGTLLTRQT